MNEEGKWCIDIAEEGGKSMEVIVKYNGNIGEVARQVDGVAEILSGSYAIVTLPDNRLEELNGFTEVEDIELPKQLSVETAFQLSSSCISRVQRNDGLALQGNGTIVAVIDSGIDYTHPDFRNPDGTTRILWLWDQTIEGKPPAGFAEGSEYDAQTINQALTSPRPFEIVPSRDRLGHGTAVTGIAAGNGRSSGSENQGTAPLASLLIVKVGRKGNDSFAQSTEIMRALRYVIRRAREAGSPAAINLSFGMNNGSHDGTSLFEEYLDEIANEWKCVFVTPTGNEGSAGHHYAGQLQSGETRDVVFFTAAEISSFYLSLWKNFVDEINVELLFPNGLSSGIVTVSDGSKTVRNGDLLLRLLYRQPTRYSVDQEIFLSVFSESGTGIPAGTWILRLRAGNITDGQIQLWLPTTEEVTGQTFFSDPTVSDTMTIPSTARKVIRVAGYNDRIGGIAPFSGVGSRDNPEKMPDLAAPAVSILTVRSGGGYDAVTGTSFAAPFVTGSSALLMEWGIVNGNAPFFYGERIKAYLRAGARRQAGMRYPNPTFGYGKLCLADTFDLLL